MVRGLVRMQSTNNKLRLYFCRLKINSLSIRCLPRSPRQHCAALSTAMLVVVVVSSLCCCRCSSSLLSSPSLSLLSSLSPRPLRPLLPPPPITSSTRRRPLRNLPQSNADACNYNTRVCDASDNRSASISLSSDADDVAQVQRVTSTVVIGRHRPPSAPPPHSLSAPPPAFVDC